MRRLLVVLVSMLALALAVSVAAGPAEGAKRKPRPWITAEAFVVIDARTGRVVLGRAAHERRPIASLTKIMTGLLVIEHGGLDRKIRIPKQATLVEPNVDGLKPRRWYTRELLLYSTMLASNNDAAAALGYDLGRGSLARFYELMNARARELGLRETVYASASGLNDDTNLSTAYDQALVSRAALANPTFAAIVATRSRTFAWPPPTHAKEYVNHNKMLSSYPGTYGVKTGYTSRARGCLAVAVQRNGHRLIAVVLGSESIWTDMRRLLRKAYVRL